MLAGRRRCLDQLQLRLSARRSTPACAEARLGIGSTGSTGLVPFGEASPASRCRLTGVASTDDDKPAPVGCKGLSSFVRSGLASPAGIDSRDRRARRRSADSG